MRSAERLRVAQQIAGTIAHEFRQPLAALQLLSDLLELKKEDQGEKESLTKRVRSSVKRIDGLVTKLLSITQLEPSNYALNLDILDLDKSTRPPRPLD